MLICLMHLCVGQGKEERDACYKPIIDEIEAQFPVQERFYFFLFLSLPHTHHTLISLFPHNICCAKQTGTKLKLLSLEVV